MSTDTFDFTNMIWPVQPDAFFRENWEKCPLVLSRKDARHYAGLFTSSDVDSLIYFSRPKFLGAEGYQQSSSPSVLRGVFQERQGLGGANDPGILELSKLYTNGKTVLVHNLQLRVPAVATLCRSLEITLHHPVNVNMYLTPPGAQGFGPHYDDHDVFIVQLDGIKHWRLYGAVRELPLKSDETTVPRERLNGPVQEARLEAGDLLYLPRGHIHEAFTAEKASLHLTVGVEVFRWADLLINAVTSLGRQNVRFRRALPAGWMDTGMASDSMRKNFRELLQLLGGEAQIDEAVAQLSEHFVGQLPALPDGRFTEPLSLEHIELDTVLEKRPGVICRVVVEGESVCVQFPGSGVTGPSKIAPALRFIAATTGKFTVRTLPDDLSDSAKLTLVRRLILEGLLTLVASPDPSMK
jgi:ribosomal protein L16 Arg81 hydroxylase